MEADALQPAMTDEKMHERVFALFNRDRSGYADEADVVAALRCHLSTEKLAAGALARQSDEGHVDAAKFRVLIEGMVHGVDEDARHQQMVRLLLAIVKDFERRATSRGEYGVAGQARACATAIRSMEEQRVLLVMQRQQTEEREMLMRQQTLEASEFNRAWRQRMDEFSRLAGRAIEEMRARHESSVEEVRRCRHATRPHDEETCARVCPCVCATLLQSSLSSDCVLSLCAAASLSRPLGQRPSSAFAATQRTRTRSTQSVCCIAWRRRASTPHSHAMQSTSTER